MAKHKICLFFSDTGGGHRSAAEAIEAGLRDLISKLPADDVPEIITDNVVEKSHPVNRFFVELYNYLLRHHQSRMKYYHWFIQAMKPNDNYWLIAPYARKLIKDIDPSVIVSVHPMSNHCLANAVKELGLHGKVKLITVVTDPNSNLWHGWACPDADLIIVPNDLAYDRLHTWGIKSENLKIMGMPIDPDFLKPPSLSRQEFLAHLGLDSETLTICINAGWAGGGNMLKVYEAIAHVKRTVQVIFLCGYNNELFKQARKAAENSPVPTSVLPFHDHMSDLMSSVDLMVTKAGGLTTFEAVARRLPMAIDLLTEAMPQEEGTAKMLCEQGLANPLRHPGDIVPIVESLHPVKNREAQPLPTAHSLDQVDAVHDIARAILEACGSDMARLLPKSGERSAQPEPDLE